MSDAFDPSPQLIKKLCLEINDLKLSSEMNKDSLKLLKTELDAQRKANAEVHNAVYLLQEEKTNLRTAVHNLKVRNGMMSKKIKQLKDQFKKSSGDGFDEDFELISYDEIGRNFIMIGGRHDPLALSYNLKFSDEDGVEHLSAERYFWYLVANHFQDLEHREIIRTADYAQAEKAYKSIVGYDEQKLNKVKLELYSKAQETKFAQLRSMQNILVLTATSYLASCESDKFFGTGWRKQREESAKPLKWDGENFGGIVLMKIRQKIATLHKWQTENEFVEAENRFGELKRHIWRRIKPTNEHNKW